MITVTLTWPQNAKNLIFQERMSLALLQGVSLNQFASCMYTQTFDPQTL